MSGGVDLWPSQCAAFARETYPAATNLNAVLLSVLEGSKKRALTELTIPQQWVAHFTDPATRVPALVAQLQTFIKKGTAMQAEAASFTRPKPKPKPALNLTVQGRVHAEQETVIMTDQFGQPHIATTRELDIEARNGTGIRIAQVSTDLSRATDRIATVAVPTKLIAAAKGLGDGV